MEYAIIGLQILAGAALFFGNGLGKIKNFSGTAQWFQSIGFGKAGAVWAVLTEGVAAALLMLGVFPRIMAGLIAITMLGAVLFHMKSKDSFKNTQAALLYLFIMVFIAIMGVSPWGLSI